MNKHTIHLASLALAATFYALPILAQKPPRGPAPEIAAKPPAPGRVARVEIETADEDALVAAHTAAADAERTVRKIFAGGESSERPLIISSSQLDEKALGNLDEDLNIMSRVLDKSFDRGGDDDHKAMGIRLWAIGGGNRARNMYIDGYGAIFMVSVNTPLQAPPSKPQVEEKKEPTSSSWEEARNELYGRDDAKREFKRPRGDKRPAPPFDAERVEELKKSLSESMKNATHIRGLKPDEYVTIVVQGPGSNRDGGHAFKVGPEGKFESDVFAYSFSGGTGGARSVMTLRAKKSDIDAFAKENGDLEDFRKKVSVAVYQTTAPGSGGGGGGVRF